MECERCGSTDFQEEDGFYFCMICQTQSQGFAREEEPDEEALIVKSREIRLQASTSAATQANASGGGGGKRGRKRKPKRARTGFSRWTTIMAFNEIYLGMIDDLFSIIRNQIGGNGDGANFVRMQESFRHISMQIWFKYLRECEIAFRLDGRSGASQPRLHPAARHRDIFLLASESSSASSTASVAPAASSPLSSGDNCDQTTTTTTAVDDLPPVPLYCQSFSASSHKRSKRAPSMGLQYAARDHKRVRENDHYYQLEIGDNSENGDNDDANDTDRSRRKDIDLITYRNPHSIAISKHLKETERKSLRRSTMTQIYEKNNATDDDDDDNDEVDDDANQPDVFEEEEDRDIRCDKSDCDRASKIKVEKDYFWRYCQAITSTHPMDDCFASSLTTSSRKSFAPIDRNENVEEIKVEVDVDGELDYDQIIIDRMSARSHQLLRFVPLDRLKRVQASKSPLFNDVISKPKLLAFLYITIRSLDLNIYLSDVIRWCAAGHIRYLNPLPHLPDNWELMWIDQNCLTAARVPSYHNVITIAQHMIRHCAIPWSIFPAVDIRPIIARYIRDLNLPAGLRLIAFRRYSRFLHRFDTICGTTGQLEMRSITGIFPEFDIAAWVVVMLTIRDIFDLFNPETDGGSKCFERYREKYAGIAGGLFRWSEWFRYSRIRLACIKSCVLNLPTSFENVLRDIDELLVACETDARYFRSRQDVPHKRGNVLKARSREFRFELEKRFEDAFFTNDHEISWRTEVECDSRSCDRIKASFYPLIEYDKFVLGKIRNEHIRRELLRNFRDQLVTPYDDDRCHHFAPIPFFRLAKFKRSNTRFFDEPCLGEPLRHLLELGSIITGADLRKFIYLFVDAEKSRMTKKG